MVCCVCHDLCTLNQAVILNQKCYGTVMILPLKNVCLKADSEDRPEKSKCVKTGHDFDNLKSLSNVFYFQHI